MREQSQSRSIAGAAGLEPATHGLEIRCSLQTELRAPSQILPILSAFRGAAMTRQPSSCGGAHAERRQFGVEIPRGNASKGNFTPFHPQRAKYSGRTISGSSRDLPECVLNPRAVDSSADVITARVQNACTSSAAVRREGRKDEPLPHEALSSPPMTHNPALLRGLLFALLVSAPLWALIGLGVYVLRGK